MHFAWVAADNEDGLEGSLLEQLDRTGDMSIKNG